MGDPLILAELQQMYINLIDIYYEGPNDELEQEINSVSTQINNLKGTNNKDKDVL